jgi:hypothetical protein
VTIEGNQDKAQDTPDEWIAPQRDSVGGSSSAVTTSLGRMVSMTDIGLSRSRSTFLTLLLVGALLLCHGVFGVAHLCPASKVPGYHEHEHPTSTDTGMAAHEHATCHLVGTEYFAVIFATFLGLILGLLFKGARLWDGVSLSFVSGRRLRPSVLHPPRGPTLPLLQVLRL